MAMADYYHRSALAASQILSGFDEDEFRSILQQERVGVAIGPDAEKSREGRKLLDLLVRLLARLYPTLVIRGSGQASPLAEELVGLATRVNPNIEFAGEPTVEIVVGSPEGTSPERPRIFAGSDGWDALIGTDGPQPCGNSDNPFGAGAAACIAAANLFQLVVLQDEAELDSNATFSVLQSENRQSADLALTGSLDGFALIGAGAVGNAAAWALSHVSMEGELDVVDPEPVDLGNLQRYVLSERRDQNVVKVELVARHFEGSVRIEPHPISFAEYVASREGVPPRLLLALDSAKDRRAAQAALPRWIGNAWTQPGDLGVSTHDFLGGACVNCLYLPQHAVENEDEIIGSALGVTDKIMVVRTLLDKGGGVTKEFLESVAAAKQLPMDRLLPFAGRPLRDLYTEGICGGAVLPLGSQGTPRQEQHVPLAHQSALAGVLLAGCAVEEALGLTSAGTHVTRVDVLRQLPTTPTQPAAKDPRGICICQDSDYQDVYRQKYGLSDARDQPDSRPVPGRAPSTSPDGVAQTGI